MAATIETQHEASLKESEVNIWSEQLYSPVSLSGRSLKEYFFRLIEEFPEAPFSVQSLCHVTHLSTPL